MGLTSALNTSVSGLSLNETEIAVIGNNVANAGATGFKESNVTFATQLAQTLSQGSAPSSTNAGSNPLQVGLGGEVAQIVPDLNQGSITLSNSPSDLAIQGDGFFILKDPGARGQAYSRDGSFHLDSAQNVTNNTGQQVLGFGVDNNFNLVTTSLVPLQIPVGTLRVSQQTKNVQITGGLSPQGIVATQGTLQTSAPLTDRATASAATGSTLLSNLALSSAPANPLFAAGQTIDFTPVISGTVQAGKSLTVTAATTVSDLEAFIGNTLGLETGGAIPVDGDGVPVGISLNASGQLVVKGNRGTANDFDLPVGSMTVAGSSVPIPFVPGANRANGESATTTFKIYDSLGTPLNVRMTSYMESQSPGKTTYRYTLQSVDQSGSLSDIGTGTIDFDSFGRISSAPTAQFAVNTSTPGAVNPMQFTLDVSQVSGISTGSRLSLLSQDGAPPGTLTNFAIDDKGVIDGKFDNGIIRTLGQIALARFPNPQGLVQTGDNNFSQGIASGLPQIDTPGTGGTGTLRAGALESSNTDLGKNLVNMIVASTNFQGNAKAITSNSQIFDTLLSLRR